MNGKRAKLLRKRANQLAYEFACDRMFDKEIIKEYDYRQVVDAVPFRILIMKMFTKSNAVGTRRWFYKQVKKNPSVTYGELFDVQDKERSDD